MAEIRPVVPLAPFRRLKDARPRDNGDHREPSNWLFLCVMKLIWRFVCNETYMALLLVADLTPSDLR
jgi:hypothetical protein